MEVAVSEWSEGAVIGTNFLTVEGKVFRFIKRAL